MLVKPRKAFLARADKTLLRTIKPGAGMVVTKEHKNRPREECDDNASKVTIHPSIMLLEPSLASPPPPAVGSADFPCHARTACTPARRRGEHPQIGADWRFTHVACSWLYKYSEYRCCKSYKSAEFGLRKQRALTSTVKVPVSSTAAEPTHDLFLLSSLIIRP